MQRFGTPPPYNTQQTQVTPPPEPMQPTQEQQFNEGATPVRQPWALNRYEWSTPQPPPERRGRRKYRDLSL